MTAEESLERRIVSVLFADLVGFTTLSEQFDAEDIAAIQDRYFAAVRETIARYGGRLEKFIGDAAMAVFGVPRARDDDGLRAARAGLALVHAISQIGAELGLEEGALELRVGINTGEAVIAAVGDDEGRVTGDTVNTAARLQAAAPPGRVLVGETTALAIEEATELEPPIALELKGKAEPVQARVVGGFRAEPSRERAMGGLHAPTLGRERELNDLSEAFARAATGATERWLVIAPPGVGKSRLVRELSERITDRETAAAVWRSRARPDSVSPFDPIAGLLHAALGDGAANEAAATAALRERLASAGMDAARANVVLEACLAVAWPVAAAVSDGKPSEDRDALFEALLEGLAALAAGRTETWLVEDVHWAGGDVLAFLDQATDARSGPGAGPGRLIVATARPSLLESSPAWAADNPTAGRRLLQLPTLEPTDTRALIDALVGDALPADLVERIAQRSDGNCLFVEELLRTWVSVGTLVPVNAAGPEGGDGRRWLLAVPAEEVPLPASVQSIYAAQLDDLPPDARRVARRVSVAGRRFPVGALEPLDAADSGLEPLRRRELVSGPLNEPLLGDAFTYRHALLRDAGYASLARAERARLHIRLARWLEQAAGERNAEVAEQIAGHYSAALESAPALARDVGDGLDRATVSRLAAEWFERAGSGTLAVAAHDAARQLFRRAIDLTPEQARLDQARRWERLGDATAYAADMDEGAAAYERAVELYREAMQLASTGFDAGSATLDQAALAMERSSDELQRRLARLAGLAGEEALQGLNEARTDLAEGAAALRSGSSEIQRGKEELQGELEEAFAEARTGLARATASLADVWYEQLRFGEARALADATLDELGDDDPASVARLLVARGQNDLGAAGPSATTEADLRRALTLARAAGDGVVELKALEMLAVAELEGGRGNPEAWSEVAALAEQQGNIEAAISARMSDAITLLDEHAEAVFGRLAEMRALATAHGRSEDLGWTDYLESEAAFLTGDWERALLMASRALDLAEGNAYRRLNVRTIHVVVPIASVRDDRPMLERAASFYRSIEGKFEFPDSPYSRVVRAAQDLELAAAGLWPPYVPEVDARIVSFEEDPGGSGSWAAALDRVFRAWLEAGEIEGAARALDAMAAAMPRYPRASRLARGNFDLMTARLALARDDRNAAAGSASRALEYFTAIAAPWWVAKALRALERSGQADYEQVARAFEIERALGATAATA